MKCGNANLHKEGMAYSPGVKNSRIVLLFESPGRSEAILNSPLSGLTGMRYCQIVKMLINNKQEVQEGLADWTDYCKCSATVINAYPFYSRVSTTKKKDFTLTEECIASILGCIQARQRDLLICFGEIACCVVNELVKNKRFCGKGPKRIIKLWHLSSRNNYFEIDESDASENGIALTKWQKQVPLIASYIRECVKRNPGIFGWKTIREVIPGCSWNGSQEGPQWLLGC